MEGYRSTKTESFTKGTPISIIYTNESVIKTNNSFPYIAKISGKWYIKCYTIANYSGGATISIIVLYM